MKFIKNRKGFTLIELLVVIAIIGILATFLIPAVTGALLNARVTQMLSNGKNIYTAVFEADAEDNFGSSVGFPAPGDFANSTDYFKALVSNDVLEVSFNFFSGPGLDAHQSTDATGFMADNNAWSVGEGVGNMKDGAPFLISRNYTAADIPGVPTGSATGSDLTGDVGDDVATATAVLKFNDDRLVVIQKGGAGYKPEIKDLKNSANINPTETDVNLIKP